MNDPFVPIQHTTYWLRIEALVRKHITNNPSDYIDAENESLVEAVDEAVAITMRYPFEALSMIEDCGHEGIALLEEMEAESELVAV